MHENRALAVTDRRRVTDPYADCATTANSPIVPFAVSGGAVAVPCSSVATPATFEPVEEKSPLAPLAGTVNVTPTPARLPVSGQPLLFASRTWRFCGNGLPSCVVWPVPPASTSSLGAFESGHGVPSAAAWPVPRARTSASAATPPISARPIFTMTSFVRRRCR